MTPLAAACHPGPTVAVTVLGALLAVASGAGTFGVARLTLVFLVGQLLDRLVQRLGRRGA